MSHRDTSENLTNELLAHWLRARAPCYPPHIQPGRHIVGKLYKLFLTYLAYRGVASASTDVDASLVLMIPCIKLCNTCFLCILLYSTAVLWTGQQTHSLITSKLALIRLVSASFLHKMHHHSLFILVFVCEILQCCYLWRNTLKHRALAQVLKISEATGELARAVVIAW